MLLCLWRFFSLLCVLSEEVFQSVMCVVLVRYDGAMFVDVSLYPICYDYGYFKLLCVLYFCGEHLVCLCKCSYLLCDLSVDVLKCCVCYVGEVHSSYVCGGVPISFVLCL